ncbi:MAG: WG repeat-containing protein [Clostridia bacterium]|jgi:hypothetical protein|nr:WG repeat-containing protein [Clostridia bacterium]
MSRGRRFEPEGQLNYQKVVAVILAIVVIIMFIFIIGNVIKQRKEQNKEYEYFVIYSADKWGVINQKGEEIITPSYREMIVIPNKTKDVFICTFDINEETGEYKTKAINSKNEAIFTKYEQVEAIDNIDKNNNIWYEQNILKVKQNGKYGLIDLTGVELLPCEYEEITALSGCENSILIKKDNKVGLVNDKGSILIDVIYKEIMQLGDTYKEGYIVVTEEGKYGAVSTTKKQLLENKYEEIKPIYMANHYVVKEENKLKIVNSSGETVLSEGFDDVKSESSRGIVFTRGEQYGEMNLSGEITIEPKYQYLKEEREGTYIAKQNDKYGIIDTEQNEKIPFEYKGITYNERANIYIAEGEDYKTSIIDSQFNVALTGILSELNTQKDYIKMRVEDEYKYYNFKCEEKPNTEILKDNTLYLSKKEGKYGYTNKKGEVIVDYIYDDATEQNEYGYAAVKKDGLWGSINSEGLEVIEPKYNLESSLKIDFIGKWHLGQDLNMNYYCTK